MIKKRASSERGYADHGWLRSFHTFSFGEYRDPEHTHFGVLRVVNQDRVLQGEGFGTHSHQDMEIVSYVLQGVLSHKDSMGQEVELRPGEVQLMSAGTGVTHSEFNGGDEELHFLQMWVFPKEKGTEPRYEQKMFPHTPESPALELVVSPDGRGESLTIGQDVFLHRGRMGGGEEASHEIPEGRVAWLHVAEGKLSVNGLELVSGDGAAITDERKLVLGAAETSDFVLWDLPGASR